MKAENARDLVSASARMAENAKNSCLVGYLAKCEFRCGLPAGGMTSVYSTITYTQFIPLHLRFLLSTRVTMLAARNNIAYTWRGAKMSAPQEIAGI